MENERNKITSKEYKRKGDIMAVGIMEKVYKEQAEDMRLYLKRLQSMPEEEARRVSKENLMKAGIVKEDGTLTERYSYSRNRRNK